MNMLVAMAAPDLRDGYEKQMQATQKSSMKARAMVALDRAKGIDRFWGSTSVAARNLVLRDAMILLDPESTPHQTDWNSFETSVLVDQLAYIGEHFSTTGNIETRNDAAEHAVELLRSLVLKANQETYPSYETFHEAQKNFDPKSSNNGDSFQDNPEEAALQSYELWLRQYRPYLVLGLDFNNEEKMQEVETEIHKRIDFFLDKNPEMVFQAKYADRLWAYIYRVRSFMKSPLNTRSQLDT